MTSMMRNDIIVAMEIEKPRKGYKGLPQEFLSAGSILAMDIPVYIQTVA